MPNTTAKHVRACTAGWVATLALLFAHSTGAATIVSLTGSGDLSLASSGAVYFDASDLTATDFTLTAADRIDIGSPFPAGIPDPTSGLLVLADLSGSTDLVLDGDVYFDVFAFSGSITFLAESIHMTGSLEASGDVVLSAGNIEITDISLIDANGGTSLCRSSGADISTWTSPSGGGCPGGGLVGGGGVIIPIGPDGSILVGSTPVPEPRAALLFFLGTVILSVRRLY